MKNFGALEPLRSLSDVVYCRASPYSKKLNGWTEEIKGCEFEKCWRSRTSQISFGFCILPRLSLVEKTKRVDGGTQRLRTSKKSRSRTSRISFGFCILPRLSLLKKLSGWTGKLKDCELEKTRSRTTQISFRFCILPRLSLLEKTKRVDGGTQRLPTRKIFTLSNLSELFRIVYTAAPLPIRKN